MVSTISIPSLLLRESRHRVQRLYTHLLSSLPPKPGPLWVDGQFGDRPEGGDDDQRFNSRGRRARPTSSGVLGRKARTTTDLVDGSPRIATELPDRNSAVLSSAKTVPVRKRKTRDKAPAPPTPPRILVYCPEYALPVRSVAVSRKAAKAELTYPIAVTGKRGRPKTPPTPPLPENRYGIPMDVWGEREARRQPKTRRIDSVTMGFANWISEYQQRGYRAYLLTFLFNQLPGRQKARVIQMGRRITRFYSALLSNMMHHPNRKVNLGRRPVMIGVPDTIWRWAAKRAFKLADVRPNDGLHFHAVFLVSPWVRQKAKPFDAFFERERHGFFDARDDLRAVHVRPMDDESLLVWNYIVKAQPRNFDAQSDILLLPDVHSNAGFREVVAEEQAATAEKTARLKAERLARDTAAAHDRLHHRSRLLAGGGR